MTTGRFLALLIAMALVLGGFVVWAIREGPHRADGPLPVTGDLSVTFELNPDETATWGTPLPGSEGLQVVVSRIEPIGVDGLDIIGIQVCRASHTPNASGELLHCAPVNSYGWPPVSAIPEPVEGTTLDNSPDPLVDVMIGVRRTSGAPDARISSIRIVYAAGGITYEAIEPWSLYLVPRGTLPAGQ